MTKRPDKPTLQYIHQIFSHFLPKLSRYSLTVLLSFAVISESVNATPRYQGLHIAQQSQTTPQDANRAAAQKAEAEARELGKQNAPLLSKIIPKWEEALKYWRLAKDSKQEANTLNRIAGFYWLRGEYPKALEYAQKALPICQALGDECEILAIGFSAWSYENMGEYQKAIDNHQKLFDYPNFNLKHESLNNSGMLYGNLGETQKALDAYNQALDFWKGKGDVVKQAQILDQIALLYARLGETNKSYAILQQANALDPEIKRDNYNMSYLSLGHSICANKLASLKKPGNLEQPNNSSNQSASDNIADWQQRVQKYHKRESLHGEAHSLEMLGGLVYQRIGEYKKALEVYNQALKLRITMGDKPKQAETLTDIADILNKQGEKQKAIDFLNQALEIQRQIKNIPVQADTLNSLGDVYSSLGAYPQSLRTYEQALSLWQKIGDRNQATQMMSNIGDVYLKLQNYPQALTYYNQALSISRTTGNCQKEALSLVNISKTYVKSGDAQQAISFANQALALSRNLEIIEYKSAIEAITLNIRAQVEIKQGNYSQALADSQKARKSARESGFRNLEVSAYAQMAEAYAALKQPQKAIQTYQEQFAFYGEMGLLSEQAQSLYNIAKLQRQNNQLPAALSEIDKAIKIIENIREQVVSQDLRTSFFATVQDYYQLKIDILMELHKKDPSKGYNALAFNTSERSRARSLLELLAEARANIRQGVEPKLLEEERSLQEQIAARRKILMEIISKQHTPKEVEAAKKVIAELQDKYSQVLADIRVKSPRYAALTQPQPLTLEQIQSSVLDDNTILLQYSLGKERSYLWLVTKTGMKSYELPKASEIETVAKKFYQSISGENIEPRGGINVEPDADAESNVKLGNKLSQMLLQPVAGELGNKRLLIVADGILQYIPFAALPTPGNYGEVGGIYGKEGGVGGIYGKEGGVGGIYGKEGGVGGIYGKEGGETPPLLVGHEIVNAPSASTIAVVRDEIKNRNSAIKKLAVLADPVFSKDDERLKSNVALGVGNSNNVDLNALALNRSSSDLNLSFNRLQGTREEADNILGLVPESSRKSAFDFAANRTTVTSPDMSQYQIVHLATHGIFDTQNPEFSGVVLSLVDADGNPQNGFLQLQDIFNLNLNAELVVLSACQTGLGEEVKGEGLVGLTRGFMYAGSPRVAVSLWSVDDKATAELMTKFYSKMLKDGLSPAAALRAAQLEMWRNPKYSQPYFWAAFTLQGEWR